MGWVSDVVDVDGAPQRISIKTIGGRVVRFETHGPVRTGVEVEILGKEYVVSKVRELHELNLCKVFPVSALPSVHASRKKVEKRKAEAKEGDQPKGSDDAET